MKTFTYGKTVDFDHKSDYVFVKGDVADCCLIVADGRCALEGRPGDYAFEAHNITRAAFVDEHAMLLPVRLGPPPPPPPPPPLQAQAQAQVSLLAGRLP